MAARETESTSEYTKVVSLRLQAYPQLLSHIHSDWFFVAENLFWYLFNIIPLYQWRGWHQCGLDEPDKGNQVNGFGQTLPLVLLLLPLMQFTELVGSIQDNARPFEDTYCS